MLPYEEDYEKARVLLRQATMAPDKVKNPRTQRLIEWTVYGAIISVVAIVIALSLGVLAWFIWAVGPSQLIAGGLWASAGMRL